MKEAEIEKRKAAAKAARAARAKSVRVKIRLTKAEKIQWQAKAKSAGMTLSQLIRECFGRVYVWSVNDRKLFAARTQELARIGNNMNQIARWCNTFKSAADAAEIIVALAAVERALQQDSLPFLPPKTESEEVTNAH